MKNQEKQKQKLDKEPYLIHSFSLDDFEDIINKIIKFKDYCMENGTIIPDSVRIEFWSDGKIRLEGELRSFISEVINI